MHEVSEKVMGDWCDKKGGEGLGTNSPEAIWQAASAQRGSGERSGKGEKKEKKSERDRVE